MFMAILVVRQNQAGLRDNFFEDVMHLRFSTSNMVLFYNTSLSNLTFANFHAINFSDNRTCSNSILVDGEL